MSEGTEEKWVSATPIFASGEYLAQMCNEIDRLRGEVAQLREERDAAEARAARLEEAARSFASTYAASCPHCRPRWDDQHGWQHTDACPVVVLGRLLTPTGGDHE